MALSRVLLLYKHEPDEIVLLMQDTALTVFAPEFGRQVIFDLRAGAYRLYATDTHIICVRAVGG